MSVKTSNLLLEAESAEDEQGEKASGACGKQSKVPSKYSFLAYDIPEGQTLEVIQKWSPTLATNSVEHQLKRLHSAVGFNLSSVVSSMPTFGETDLVIARVGNSHEVFAARDSPA